MANSTIQTNFQAQNTQRKGSAAPAASTAAVPTEKVTIGQTEQPPVTGKPSFPTVAAAATPQPKADAAKPESATEEAAENLSAEQKQAEIRKRLNNDVVVELAGGDLPGVGSMLANSPAMAKALGPILLPLNIFNAATGFVGAINDGVMAGQSSHNPAASRMDKAVDLGHFLAGTVLSDLSDFIPVFDPAMNSHPLPMILFNGGQLLGLVMDCLHTRYDFVRGGAQSHIEGTEKDKARYAIMGNAEKTISKTLQGAGTMGVWAEAFNHSLGMPSEVLSSITTLGGSAGLILGGKQVKEAQGLRTSLQALKDQGVTTLRFPVNTKHGPDLKEISMDEALKRCDSMQRWGRAQEGTGALTMAAGITGIHIVCLAAFGGCIGLGVAGVGMIAYKLLPPKAKAQVDKVLQPIGDAAHKVAEFAKPVTEPIDKAVDLAMDKTLTGIHWAGHKAMLGAKSAGRAVKKGYEAVVPDPVQEVLAKGAHAVARGEHATELGAYHVAEKAVDGMIAAGHAAKQAGTAVGHFTQEHAPALADAAVTVGHHVQKGAAATATYVNKAFGNAIEESTPESKAPAALPEDAE